MQRAICWIGILSISLLSPCSACVAENTADSTKSPIQKAATLTVNSLPQSFLALFPKHTARKRNANSTIIAYFPLLRNSIIPTVPIKNSRSRTPGRHSLRSSSNRSVRLISCNNKKALNTVSFVMLTLIYQWNGKNIPSSSITSCQPAATCRLCNTSTP